MKQILNILNKNNSFALFCHISPDADALGSMNALRLVLKKLNKKVYMYCDGKVPKNISFLNVNLDTDTSKIGRCDVCIMIDCNSLERIGKYAEFFDKAKIKVNIDHHQAMHYPFDCAYVDSKSPSTADLMYVLIKNMKVTINGEIAQSLYAGLSSDTSCFQNASTSQLSHKHAYELINYNFNLQEVNYNMFRYKQKDFLYFYKNALRNTKSYLKEKLYVTFFNYKAYKRFDKICDDSVSFQFLDGIEGNEIRVKIMEKQKGFFTISFRSNKYANVCAIAQKFDGGGHLRASGGRASGNYKEILSKIISYCEEELKNNKDAEKQEKKAKKEK